MKKTFNFLNLPGGTVRLAVTNRCNMNCFYCHNEGQDKDVYHDLTFDDFKKIMEVSQEHGMVGVSFTGGEPFINKDLPKMINWCVENKLKKVDICSNGILIPQNMELLKKSKNISIVIGIDRCDSDLISKQSDIGVKFSQIEKNIQLLKQNGIDFSINTVYTVSNKKQVLEIIEYCRKNDIDQRIIEEDKYEALSVGRISPEFMSFIDEVRDRYALELGYAEPGKGFFAYFDTHSKISFYHSKCHARDCLNCARWALRIDSWGRATPCYARDLRIPILGIPAKEMKQNYLQAIYNLGIPPEMAETQEVYAEALN